MQYSKKHIFIENGYSNTYVLLKVALMFAIARVTLRLIFFLPTFDMVISYPQTKKSFIN